MVQKAKQKAEKVDDMKGQIFKKFSAQDLRYRIRKQQRASLSLVSHQNVSKSSRMLKYFLKERHAAAAGFSVCALCFNDSLLFVQVLTELSSGKEIYDERCV